MNQIKEETKEEELKKIKSILLDLGFNINSKQPHISGERGLMRAVTTTSGKKFILLGEKIDNNQKVVIKITKDDKGKKEILQERISRQYLKKIEFAYKIFFTPKEILFTERENYLISIQVFLTQKSTFLDRPIEEQFDLALQSFKAQEGAHATTYRHQQDISKTFGRVNTLWYLNSYIKFQKNIKNTLPEKENLHLLLAKGLEELEKNKDILTQYGNFLTHTDFVPHNFRIIDGKIYLLDHSSLRFGNKYEGWARFLNFMTLYNRPLEKALLFYVKNNRTKEEFISLRLMRIYRLGEIIWYYTNLLDKTSGDLYRLTETRIKFWTSVLETILKKERLSDEVVNEYKKVRDSLRSEEEKERQKDLH